MGALCVSPTENQYLYDQLSFYPQSYHSNSQDIEYQKEYIEEIKKETQEIIVKKIDVVTQILEKQGVPILDEKIKQINERLQQDLDIPKNDPLPLKALQAIASVTPAARGDILQKMCQELKQITAPLPPKVDSIILDTSPQTKEVVKVLEELNTSKEFLSTTKSEDIQNINDQIECITGVNLITGAKVEITKFKVESPKLENNQFIFENEKQIRETLRQDLAKLYGVSPGDVKIQRVVAGSIEVYFSLPEKQQFNPAVSQQNLPSFRQIMEKNGINDFTTQTNHLIPDFQKAKDMMKNYTTPVVIQTRSADSELMRKFGDYLPILASLSTNVRIVNNEETGTLEIHGPPSAKSSVLKYLASLEDQLQGAKPIDLVVVQQIDRSLEVNYFPELWIVLFNQAKQEALNGIYDRHTLQTNTIRINPNLVKGVPAAKSFVAALERLNLGPRVTNPETILSQGLFGWHGTKTSEAVLGIAIENLDPSRRNGQCFGPGEYCAIDPIYSMINGYWGDTNTLFLFFILKNPPNQHYKLKTHHVVNNPSKNEMYMVPILIATFNDKQPLKIELDYVQPIENVPQYLWEWKGDDCWVSYGQGQLDESYFQRTLEELYQLFMNGQNVPNVNFTFIRLNDNNTAIYEINFQTMIQTNQSTRYKRKIRRTILNNQTD